MLCSVSQKFSSPIATFFAIINMTESLLHISGMCGPLTLLNPISASVSHPPHVALEVWKQDP